MSEYYDIIRKHAILNRIEHGKANEKAVLGKVVSEAPEAKEDIQALMNEVKYIVDSVNEMPEDILQEYAPELSEEEEEEEDRLSLSEGVEGVKMRFAPNPNGPATLGSARGIVVNSELVEKYSGKLFLRFDDTDPKTKKPMREAYGWYIEDCEWLGARPDEIYYASERVSLYYEYGEMLIEKGKAYVCFCSQKEFKEYKDSGEKCPHRETKTEANQSKWLKMLQGEYEEGECVLRIKTDMSHKDPAIRDWVAFRVLYEEHPRVGDKFIVWPTLDFQSAIEDYLLGITHIIRGKDLIDSEKRQKYVYDYLGWDYPETLHWGRIKIEEFGKFSTSQLKKDIENGKYVGWDDPQIPTLRALRRRGITPQAIRKIMLDLGIGETDVSVSMKTLYAENRKVLDPEVNRYFFVEDPVQLNVKDAEDMKVELPLHPDYPDRGTRVFNLSAENGLMKLYIPREDVDSLQEGDEIRLKDSFNVEIESISEKGVEARYLDEKNLQVPKIHFVQDHLEAMVVKPDELVNGYVEPACKDIPVETIVQLERYGFARLDSMKTASLNVNPVFYFAHR